MGRRCRTLLPIASSLLKPRYDTETDNRTLIGIKQRQQYYYNRAVKPLKTITPGETVRMKLPGQDTWSPGTCTEQRDKRSYIVRVGDTHHRWSSRHLRRTNEPPVLEPPEAGEALSTPPEDSLVKPSDHSSEAPATDPANTRPRRTRRNPVWHKDYVMSPK